MMQSQENFDSACINAKSTLVRLTQAPYPVLANRDIRQLSAMLWELELISTAIRNELNTRGTDGPVDTA